MVIAVDIDGTIARSDGSISQHTVETIVETQRRGHTVVIASGRPTYGIAPVADLLRLGEFGGYVMSFNGGILTNWQTKYVLFQQVLPADILPILVQKSHETHHALLTYKDNVLMTEFPNDKYIAISSQRNKMPILGVEEFIRDVPLPLNKCIFTGSPGSLAETEKEMQTLLQGKCSVYRSDPFFLEFTPLGIDKAKTLATLLQHLGLERKNLIAFGDGYNDISMIRFAGTGVAMANASESVRIAADIITRSNDEDGVAFIIESL